jgi:tRNA (guanine10-N2)-methyltransferase
MIEDLLDFAALTLVDGGRLSMWMPTANDEDVEIAIPQHQCFKLVSVCVQDFNKCKSSIRLLLANLLTGHRVEEVTHLLAPSGYRG